MRKTDNKQDDVRWEKKNKQKNTEKNFKRIDEENKATTKKRMLKC